MVLVDISVDGVGPVVGRMDTDLGGDGDATIVPIFGEALALVLGALTIKIVSAAYLRSCALTIKIVSSGLKT
jgi:hypothetical protein